MSSGGYKITDQGATHFVSFCRSRMGGRFYTKGLPRYSNRQFKTLPGKKGLVVYCLCIISNHVHLIISAKEKNLSDVFGDFKKFTSKKLTDAILTNPVESRKKWMIQIFKEAGELNSRNTNYQFWQQDNQPKVYPTISMI